jgi:hypothetical protein
VTITVAKARIAARARAVAKALDLPDHLEGGGHPVLHPLFLFYARKPI